MSSLSNIERGELRHNFPLLFPLSSAVDAVGRAQLLCADDRVREAVERIYRFADNELYALHYAMRSERS